MQPRALAFLDEERQAAESFSKAKTRRVKFEKVNEAWLVRFMPVEMGSSRRWFVRQCQHWLNKQPIVCPRGLSPDFGGNPDAECPVCTMSAELNNDPNEDVSRKGYKLGATMTYLTWCLVYQIDHGRGDVEEMPLADLLKPYEFQHYKSSFDELTNFYRRGYSEKRPDSIMDLEHGCDFWVTKQKKGLHWDRQDAAPCLAEENFDKNLQVIFDQIHEPKIKLPTLKELEVFARKGEADAFGEAEPAGHGHGQGQRGRRNESDDGEDAGEEVPRRQGRGTADRSFGRTAPVRAQAAPEAEREPTPEQDAQAPVDGDAPTDDDQIPGAEVPVRPKAAARAGQAPARRQSPPPVDEVDEPPPTPRQAAPVRATAPAATAARPLSAAGRPQPVRAVVAATSSVDPEEDPGVADEVSDKAPVAAGRAPASVEQAGHAEPPRPSSGLKDKLLSRVRRV